MALPPQPIKSPTHSHVATPKFLYVLLLALALNLSACPAHSVELTALLSPYPDLSHFASLLSSTPSLTPDLTHRSSLTLLAVPNSYLSNSLDFTRHLSPSSLADLLRYHILLQYLSWPSLHQIPPSGILVTTLFQTTGRAFSNSGSVNITRDPSTNSITIFAGSTNATVLSLVNTVPYNFTILSVNSLLIPSGFDLIASETRPPLGLNITKALIDGHNFNVAVSMLTASGVVEEFEADEGGAGITLFVPTDTAFSDLPNWANLQSLPADRKAVVLKFHVLHSYYPLGSLESIVNPVEPTLATEDMGAGRFTLNISRVNGSVGLDSGIVQASVTQTVFDQNPVAIFGVSGVLLPKEYFGKAAAVPSSSSATKTTPSSVVVVGSGNAGAPDIAVVPAGAPEYREEMKSGGSGRGLRTSDIGFGLFCCIGLCLFI